MRVIIKPPIQRTFLLEVSETELGIISALLEVANLGVARAMVEQIPMLDVRWVANPHDGFVNLVDRPWPQGIKEKQ